MSLYKQLWLAIVVLLSAIFCISISVTTLSAKQYLEEQLSIKNSDNAAALALSLSQHGADEILLELTLSAQFDTGFYQRIELLDPSGKTLILREDKATINSAPAWFVALLPINAQPGIASVQSGWNQTGTLQVISHSRFAYNELWQSSIRLAGIFLAIGVLAGLLGNHLLKRILRPLSDVVSQAEAIKQRRFVAIDEPATEEFKRVVSSMNSLSRNVQTTLTAEARRLQQCQQKAQFDAVTGLKNREPFLTELTTLLSSNSEKAAGAIILIRIADLTTLNDIYGRKQVDALLHDVGKALNSIAAEQKGWSACRLNGSDFAVLAPRELDVHEFSARIHQTVEALINHYSFTGDCIWPAAATVYSHGETNSALLTRLDAAISAAQAQGSSSATITHLSNVSMQSLRDQLGDWRVMIEQGLAQARFSLHGFPVLDRDDQLLHMEAHARLDWNEQLLNAGQFLPWVNRLQLSTEFDKCIVKLALNEIEFNGKPTAIALTRAALTEEAFVDWLETTLINHSLNAPRLWLELPEDIVFAHFTRFKALCHKAKLQGARVGIEHVGHQLADLGKLHDVGLDFLKVDASFVRGIDDNPMNQTLLRTLCTLGHSVGVDVYAEGVESAAEKLALLALGIDGMTGPAVRAAG